jgi:acyl-CoA synthetase (AMP-forming)/AMP-acid ligase II
MVVVHQPEEDPVNDTFQKPGLYRQPSVFAETSVIGTFDRHVARQPDALIYSWLDGEANVVKSFTRKELWIASRNLGYELLTKHGIKRGDRAMIVYPLGIDFLVAFVACLRVGIIVVSVYPPNLLKLQGDIQKFKHFATDSGAKIALTTNKYRIAMKLKPWIKWPKGINWVTTDSVSTSRCIAPVEWDGWYEAPMHDVAFIQVRS